MPAATTTQTTLHLVTFWLNGVTTLTETQYPDAVDAARRSDVPRVFGRRVFASGGVTQTLATLTETSAQYPASIQIASEVAIVCTDAELAELTAWLDRYVADWRTQHAAHNATAVAISAVPDWQRSEALDTRRYQLAGQED